MLQASIAYFGLNVSQVLVMKKLLVKKACNMFFSLLKMKE